VKGNYENERLPLGNSFTLIICGNIPEQPGICNGCKV